MRKDTYRARVDERHFLNLPGHHAGAFVNCYVEDTATRDLEPHRYGDGVWNPRPRLLCEVADCSERISLEFEISDSDERHNSFHKIDTLISALQTFRQGLVDECALYRERQRKLEERETSKTRAPKS